MAPKLSCYYRFGAFNFLLFIFNVNQTGTVILKFSLTASQQKLTKVGRFSWIGSRRYFFG